CLPPASPACSPPPAAPRGARAPGPPRPPGSPPAPPPPSTTASPWPSEHASWHPPCWTILLGFRSGELTCYASRAPPAHRGGADRGGLSSRRGKLCRTARLRGRGRRRRRGTYNSHIP